MLFNLKIAGIGKNSYFAQAKDLISIADFSLLIPNDSHEKIAYAIKNEGLIPLYFHKTIQDSTHGEMLECYPFEIVSNYKLQYFSNFHRIFFLKSNVLEVDQRSFCFGSSSELHTPKSRITTHVNIIPILKKTIRLAGKAKYPSIHPQDVLSNASFAAYCFLEFLMNLIVINNFFRVITGNYEYNTSYIAGYSSTLFDNNTNTSEDNSGNQNQEEAMDTPEENSSNNSSDTLNEHGENPVDNGNADKFKKEDIKDLKTFERFMRENAPLNQFQKEELTFQLSISNTLTLEEIGGVLFPNSMGEKAQKQAAYRFKRDYAEYLNKERKKKAHAKKKSLLRQRYTKNN